MQSNKRGDLWRRKTTAIKYRSYKGVVGKIKKNRINRRFNTCIPYQKITTDTTEFKYYEEDKAGKLQTKKLYLDPYMDMYNLEIISYVLSDQPNGVTMLQGLEEAIERTNGWKTSSVSWKEKSTIAMSSKAGKNSFGPSKILSATTTTIESKKS